MAHRRPHFIPLLPPKKHPALSHKHHRHGKHPKPVAKDPALSIEILFMIMAMSRPDTLFAFSATCKQLRIEAARNMHAELNHKQQKSLLKPTNFHNSVKVINAFAARYDYHMARFCATCDVRVPFAHPFIFGPKPTYLCLACAGRDNTTRILAKEEAVRAGFLWEDVRHTHHFLHDKTVYLSYRHMMEFMAAHYDLSLKGLAAQRFERNEKWEKFLRVVTEILQEMSSMTLRDKVFVRNNLSSYAFEEQTAGQWGCRFYSQRPVRRIVQDLDTVLCVINRQREKNRKPTAPKIHQIRDRTIFYHLKVF